MSRSSHMSGEVTGRGRSSSASSLVPSYPPLEDEGSLPVSMLERIVDICNEFEDLWHCGEEPRIEDYLGRDRDPERAERLTALMSVELELRFRSGIPTDLDEYLGRFPDDAARVREVFDRVREEAGRTLIEPRSDATRGRGDGSSSSSRAPSEAEWDDRTGIDGPPLARRGGGRGWGEDDEVEPEPEPGTYLPEDGTDDDRDEHDLPTLSGNDTADLTFVLAQAEVIDAVGEEYEEEPAGDAPGHSGGAGSVIAEEVGREGSGRRRAAGPAPTYDPPERQTGRFTLHRLIDSGMYGDVYLATDDVLHRKVALKFPRMGASVSSARVEAFLVEARNAAQLQHRGIVAVHDIVERQGGGGGIFVVMELITGSTLRDLLRTERLPAERAAALIAEVADAVHYAHGRGFIHRDLKPANLLIDELGNPHVADFGLAVHERALGDHAGEVAGTIPYMAPEQIRGASHRIDGRTDIWALGVILYEMLTGARPFPSERMKASKEIIWRNPRPPRDIEPSVPAELERICMKCLSKRMRERYATAEELAGELRRWLSGRAPSGPGSGGAGFGSGEHPSTRLSAWTRVVPKGLRPFSPEDAPFFLDLMPGPRDRNALPECVRFWKTRIDSTDRETAFPVGLIHGPAGCGKSSLVQAGILPRLAPHVLTVSIAMAREGAEAELPRRIRQRCPGLPASLGLPESIRALREGTGLPPGKKLLIVLDQFEQWLQSHAGRDGSALAEALRGCDGTRVQALILVRDDFWTPLNRLLRPLEIELSAERDMAAVDPFDRRHARAVLAAFGRGHGALPEDPEALDEDQRRFLDRAIDGLAEGGRVVSVHLALFAEMVKDRPWTPATLDEIGGILGARIAFLENAIGDRAQHPVLKPNGAAARAILRALLPPDGVDLAGYTRPGDELIRAAGYADRRRDFEAILRVLDGELRLITPAEPEGERPLTPPPPTPGSAVAPAPGEDRGPRYRLTHDSLVGSIREWLERRERQARRGRARPSLLPSSPDWPSIRRSVLPGERADAGLAIMRAATERLGWKLLAVSAVVAVAIGFGWLPHQTQDRFRWADLLTFSSSPRPEMRRGADGHGDPGRAQTVEAFRRRIEGLPLDPAKKQALVDEFRRLFNESLASPRDPSRPGP